MTERRLVGHGDACAHPLWQKRLQAIPLVFVAQDLHDRASRVNAIGTGIGRQMLAGMELIRTKTPQSQFTSCPQRLRLKRIRQLLLCENSEVDQALSYTLSQRILCLELKRMLQL